VSVIYCETCSHNIDTDFDSTHVEDCKWEADGQPECAWCGDDQPDVRVINPRWFPNKRGETFCSRGHREASGRALRRFLS